jgi:hypothetical protein
LSVPDLLENKRFVKHFRFQFKFCKYYLFIYIYFNLNNNRYVDNFYFA